MIVRNQQAMVNLGKRWNGRGTLLMVGLDRCCAETVSSPVGHRMERSAGRAAPYVRCRRRMPTMPPGADNVGPATRADGSSAALDRALTTYG